ncbi:MAG TPA: PilZ domain-containing protein [Bryobacteraceae bacterium]|nr:PilZ domain-containing protein [Bryobacteraceae bacterium]
MSPQVQERRKRERVGLRCPVLAFRGVEEVPLSGHTVNLSSEGIYWLADQPLHPGERLHCSIRMTPHGFRCGAVSLCLRCEVEIVRVDPAKHGFGVACRIEEYVLTTEQQSPPGPLSAAQK